MSDIVWTEDISSQRIHRRVREGAALLVDERCNLDAAGAFRVLTEVEFAAVAGDDRLCQHCFPRGDDEA